VNDSEFEEQQLPRRQGNPLPVFGSIYKAGCVRKQRTHIFQDNIYNLQARMKHVLHEIYDLNQIVFSPPEFNFLPRFTLTAVELNLDS
jgi:ribosomal protein S30